MASSSPGRRAISIAVIVVLAVVVATLSIMALSNSRSPSTAATPEPSMTVSAAAPSPTPTVTPTPTEQTAAVSRADERFLSYAGTNGWRAIAGACGGAAPVLQRIDDQGAWIDITPSGFDLQQIASLDAYPDGAELVAGVDDACTATSLRTFSAGSEWTTYDGSLAQSRYVMLDDPTLVHTRAGDITAPCAEPTGLRASGEVAALVCDEQAWVQADAEWTALPIASVRALAIDATDLVIGHVTDECSGLALTRIAGEANTTIGCAEDIDAAAPLAVAATDSGVAVWAGDSILEVSE